jgi:hypothetical protein
VGEITAGISLENNVAISCAFISAERFERELVARSCAHSAPLRGSQYDNNEKPESDPSADE